MKGRVGQLGKRAGNSLLLSLFSIIYFLNGAAPASAINPSPGTPVTVFAEPQRDPNFDYDRLNRRIETLKRLNAKLPYGSEQHRRFLVNRYHFDPATIDFSQAFPLIWREGLQQKIPITNPDQPVTEIEKFDAVIVGSGPAGLTAGVYLTDAGKKVLILEKNHDVGGLAASGDRYGIQYGRGSAYFPSADGLLLKIYKKIGIDDYDKRFPIPEPIDRFMYNGVVYDEVWSDETVKKMPSPFALLRYALRRMDDDNRVPDQPFEEFPWIEETDSITMETWVKRIPQMMEYWIKDDPFATEIWERYKNSTDYDPTNPMHGPLALLDLYGRSALGEHPTMVNAAAYINFYLNELDTRYTGARGAGEVSHAAYEALLKHRGLTKIKTGAKVTKLENIWLPGNVSKTPDFVDVYYESNGVAYKVRAKDAVFSAPLRLASKAIANYEQLAPEHYKLTSELEYRDYMVINVHTAGHPWIKAYDSWLRNDKDYDQTKITDVIDGRWMDFKGKFLVRTDDRGVLTIYFPMNQERSQGRMTRDNALKIANDGINQMLDHLNTQLKKEDKEPIVVLAAEVNYWEDSIHIPKPGHFHNAATMKEPVGRIHFANNNLGTPSVEEALYRGEDVAQTIINGSTCEGALFKQAN